MNQEINTLGESAIRKICRADRNARFTDTRPTQPEITPISSKPFQRYVITQEDGEIGDQSANALEPCGMAFARELYFELGSGGEELSGGCWKPCETPVQKIFDSHGQTFALQGDMVIACLSDQGRLETFHMQGTQNLSAKYTNGQFEVYRCGEATGFLLDADAGGETFEEYESAILYFTPNYNYEDCTSCGCWNACKKKMMNYL